MASSSAIFFLMLLVAASSATSTMPMAGIFQSSGDSCAPLNVGACTPCGSDYYKCSLNDGSYSCTTSTFSDCSAATQVGVIHDSCNDVACSIALLPNYELEVSSSTGVAFFYGFAYGLNLDDADYSGTMSINSTDLTVTGNSYKGFMTTSTTSDGVLFLEQDTIFSDNTFLTNKGFCSVNEWCTADADLTYRLKPLASNGTRPVTSDPEGVVSLHIDAPSVVTTSEDIEMTLDDARMYISEDQIASLEANIWPTGVKWSQFQLKEVYGDQEIFWEVDAGSDFSVYRQEMCDDDDGNAACHLDPLFSVSGIISNPFINPFFSFSVLFEDAEPSASELGWDEKPAFSLFE